MVADRELVGAMLREHADEAARAMGGFAASEVAEFLAEWPAEAIAPVAEALPAPMLGAVLASAAPDQARALVTLLEVDTLAAAVRPLDEPLRERLLATLEDRTRALVRERLEQAERTAGAVAEPRVIAVAIDATVAEALEAVRRTPRAGPEVFVVDPPSTFRGQIAVPELLQAAPETRLGGLLEGAATSISMRAPVGSLASHPGWRRHHALAVVDDGGRLLGAVSAEQLAQASRGTGAARPVGMAVPLAELGWLGLTGVIDGLAHVATRSTPPSGANEEVA